MDEVRRSSRLLLNRIVLNHWSANRAWLAILRPLALRVHMKPDIGATDVNEVALPTSADPTPIPLAILAQIEPHCTLQNGGTVTALKIEFAQPFRMHRNRNTRPS